MENMVIALLLHIGFNTVFLHNTSNDYMIFG